MSATSANAGLLLSDNFTGTDHTNNPSNDPNFNLAGRQSGSLATLAYTTNGGNVQVGNDVTLRTPPGPVDGDYLLTAFNGKISPNQNFNGALSQGGLQVTFRVSPEVNANSTDWSEINLGAAVADRFAGVNQGVNHLGILFRSNGGLQAFDGATNVVAGGEGSYGPTGLGGNQNAFYGIRITMTDPTDNNPFDGVGQTNVDVYSDLVNGGTTPVFSFVKGGGGYTDNYLTLSSIHIGGFDDLAITQLPVPEPASLGICLMGGLAIFSRRGKRA
jgi:hypothetical protein